MKQIFKVLAPAVLVLSLSCGFAVAAQGNNDNGQQHDQSRTGPYVHTWKKGEHIRPADWNYGIAVDDWRQFHLRRPPRGSEWRLVDGEYILAKGNGLILDVVVPH